MAGKRPEQSKTRQSVDSLHSGKVAIYARVSTEEQATNTSIPLQLSEGEHFCKQNGFDYVEYIDNFSGASISREGWRKLFRDIESGEIDGIWVKATDRFSRNTKDGLTALEIIRKKGIRFFVAQEEQNINTPEFQMLITMQFAFAQYELGKILDRTLDGRIRRADAGGRKIQQTLGYENAYDERGFRTLKIKQGEADLVKYIFSLFIEEQLPFNQIAKRLNDEGYRTKNHGKKIIDRITKKETILSPLWTSVHIGNILRRPEYAGLVWDWDHKNLLPAKYIPALVSVEDWETVQASISSLAPIRNRDGNPRMSNHELSGLIRCECCNAQYYWRGGSKYKDYYYHKGDNKLQRTCKNMPKYVPVEDAEHIIGMAYLAITQRSTRMKQVFKQYQDQVNSGAGKLKSDAERIQGNIDDVEKRIEVLLNAIEDGTISRERAKERMKKHEEELSRLQHNLAEVQETLSTTNQEYNEALAAFQESMRKEWINGTPAKRREIYYRIFDRVSIKDRIFYVTLKVGGTLVLPIDELKGCESVSFSVDYGSMEYRVIK